MRLVVLRQIGGRLWVAIGDTDGITIDRLTSSARYTATMPA